jgi:hypothetical protein
MVEAVSFALFFGITAGALAYCLSQLTTHRSLLKSRTGDLFPNWHRTGDYEPG